MRYKRRKVIALYKIMCFDLLLFSCTFMFMPLASNYAQKTESRIPNNVMGSLFWVFLITGYVLFIYINSIRILDTQTEYKHKKIPGIFTVCSGKTAVVTDILLVISIAFFGICIPWANEHLLYISISLMIFLLQMHCFVNGNNYRYIQKIKKGEH